MVRHRAARAPILAWRARQNGTVGEPDQQALNVRIGRCRQRAAGNAPCECEALGRRYRSLDDASGQSQSRNVYWLSTRPDVLAWDKSEWYVTPLTQSADLTGLQSLAPAEVKASVRFESGRAHVALENPSQALAFFVHLAVRKGAAGEEVLPVLWDDNYITLLPGEKREIAARYAPNDLGSATPVVTLEGWNVKTQVLN